jgi:hypothetical protein
VANNRVLGVALEGIGSDTSKSSGVCLFYGLRQPLTWGAARGTPEKTVQGEYQ